MSGPAVKSHTMAVPVIIIPAPIRVMPLIRPSLELVFALTLTVAPILVPIPTLCPASS